MVNVYRWIAFAAFLILFVTLQSRAHAGDEERDRKVRVALALASAKEKTTPTTAPAVAPMPHPKVIEPDCPAGIVAPIDWLIRARLPAKSLHAARCPCGDPCPCASACPCPVPHALRDALVRVSRGNGSGSGTAIWSDGRRSVVLTAAHVVDAAGAIRVRAGGKWHTAELLRRGVAADLAALLVPAGLPTVKVAAGDPARGSEVLMFGVTSLWSKGTIQSTEQLDGRAVYLLGYDSDSGDSGGGVFVAGELVGVHCGKVAPSATATGTPYCTAAKPTRDFLATVFQRDGDTLTPVAAPVPPPAVKAKRIIGYTCGIDQYGRRVCVPVYEQP